MAITLKFSIKDGKTPIEASVTEEGLDEAVVGYQGLLERFGGATSPSASSRKKPIPPSDETPKPAGAEEVSPLPAAEPTRIHDNNSVSLGLTALAGAKKMGLCIPQFGGKTPHEIVQQLGFSKPLGGMTNDEVREVNALITNTLKLYEKNNPAVEAYSNVMRAINGLKQGTQEEWQAACAQLEPTVWPLLQLEGNAHLLKDITDSLTERCAVLQAAASAG